MSETGMQHGYLVLADISGYTSYVAKTELEHSQEILTELLEVLINNMTTLLTLSKLEGDAVFAYVSEHKVPRSETILELVEATYVAFKDRVTNMNRRTTCTCNACRNIPLLDLKFVVHHGDYIRQNIMGINELVGSDVNLAHRLLKNHVAEATNWRAYALFTQDALEHIGIPLDDAHPEVETYEHLGEVKTYSFNLQERYKALKEARRVFVEEKDADYKIVLEIHAPPAIVWTWVNDPNKRNQCALGLHELEWRAGQRVKGRTGVGARNHCAHGGGESVETITDWRPFEYFSTHGLDEKMKMHMDDSTQLTPLDDGQATELRFHMRVGMKMPKAIKRIIVPLMMDKMFKLRSMYENTKRFAEDEYQRMQLEQSAHESETASEPDVAHEHG
ncbi:MAG: DUF2652 domain-containing protein [Chloroflexi bacterium]|nr:DUF2652 domain-containing protein [Chloroflexota bacterium]